MTISILKSTICIVDFNVLRCNIIESIMGGT